MSGLADAAAGSPVRFTAEDRDWLLTLLAEDTVNPLEGGRSAGLSTAQGLFAAGAASRGLALRNRSAPPVGFLDLPGVPEAVREAAGSDPAGFLAWQPSVVVGSPRTHRVDRRLVFNFHMDTVGPHLTPRLANGVIHGRGSVDDKGPGVAAVLGVAAAFAAAPELADEIEVLVASVPGEEGGAMGVYGTRWLVESGWTGRLMVFAEPTDCRTLDACSATMTPVVSVRGMDSTDDHPYGGHNATVALGHVACLLTERVGPVAEKLGAKLCVAGMMSGPAHNRVYGSGQLRLNIAYFNDRAAAELAAAVEETLAIAGDELRRRFPGNAVTRRLAADWESVVSLQWLKRGLPALANRDPALEPVLAAAGLPRHDGIADGSAFTCDAIWAAAPGRYVVTCGPGSLQANGAHTEREHVALADLESYAGRCRDLVLNFGAWAGRRPRRDHLIEES